MSRDGMSVLVDRQLSSYESRVDGAEESGLHGRKYTLMLCSKRSGSA